MTAIQIISLTLCLESANQGFSGRELVASAIFNRAESITAESLVAVCLKPYAFSCWNRKKPNIRLVQKICATRRGRMLWENAMNTAKEMVHGEYVPVTEATHYITHKLYHSRYKPAWTNELEEICRHKDHVFMK